MLLSLDSAIPPTPAQVAAAKAAGVGMWCVYIATKPGVGLLRPWSDAEIEVVRPLNPHPIAFYSGWDDAAAVKAKAARLGLRPCLDNENGIRPDGSWVQPNLDTVGGGLYGVSGVHVGRRAAFHIAAWYVPRDPAATWPPSWPAPGTPCGWQWYNTHEEFGVGVDRSWLDDWFATPAKPKEDEMFLRLALPDGAQYLLSDHGWLAGVNDATSANGLQAAGIPVAQITQPFLDSIKAALPASAGASPGGSAAISGSLTLTPK